MGFLSKIGTKNNLMMALVALIAAIVTSLVGGDSAVTDDGFEITIPIRGHELLLTGETIEDGLYVCAMFDENTSICHTFPDEMPVEEGTGETLEVDGTGETAPEFIIEEGTGEASDTVEETAE